MVGIISSSGLGLFDSSADRLGSPHGNPTSLGQAKGSAYVNIATGNLSVQFLDETLSGTGVDLSALRTYNSQGSYVDGDADGWRWNGEKKVVLTGTANSTSAVVTRTTGDGTATIFKWDGVANSNRYVSTAGSGAHDVIVWKSSANEWVYFQDGSDALVERYDGATSWIKTSRDNSGNGFDYIFTGNLLTGIKDLSSGQTLEFTYTNNKLAEVSTRTTATGALTKQVYYAYHTTGASSGRLKSVTTDLLPDGSISDGKVYTTNYAYFESADTTNANAHGKLKSISQSDGTSASFAYDTSGRIYTVSDQTGTTTFTYDVSSRTTFVKNGNNDNWAYTYNALSELVSHTSSFNNGVGQKASYTYDSQGNVKTITDGRDKTITYDYDSNGNREKEYDSLGNTISRTFDTNNRLVTETKYTVASTTAPSGTETARYVYDTAGRLRFVVSAEGRVSENRYNALGLATSSRQYAGKLYDVSGLSSIAVLTETQLNTWIAGLTGDQKKQTQVTDFRYDYRGNLERKTDYSTADTSANGVLDSATTIVEYIYSEHGQLRQTIATTGAIVDHANGGKTRATKTILSSFDYDGMGRQITAINDNVTTTTIYSGLNITVTNTATGLTTVSTTDALGRLVSLTQSGSSTNRITKYYYDNAGQLRMTEDPTGARSYVFYDHAGRVNAKVDAAGAATVYTRDNDGRVLTETRYANLISSATLTAWGTTPPLALAAPTADSTNDRKTTYTYDEAGRLKTTTVDGLATVTNFYDGASRLIRTEQGDRITRYFYDKDGRKVGELDAVKYLKEFVYDSAGRLTMINRWGGNAYWGSDFTLNAIRNSVKGGGKLTTYYFYDAQGRQSGIINEQGFLTEIVYDEVNNRRQEILYKTPVSVAESSTFEITESLTAVKGRAGSTNSTTTQYDLYGRIETVTTQDGTINKNIYDSAGRLIRQIQAEGSSDERATRTRYNAFNEVTGIVNGVGDATLSTTPTTTQIDMAITNYGTRYDIDGSGRKIAEYGANGQKTFLFYNAAGQLTFTMNALGEVGQNIYNAFGQISETRIYNNRLSSADLALFTTGGRDNVISTKVAADNLNDKVDKTTYNKIGKIYQEIDAEGVGTQKFYTTFGELWYQNVPAPRARWTYTYDALGRERNRTNSPSTSYTFNTSYDGYGRVWSEGLIEHPYQYNYQLLFSDNGRTVQTTDALGRNTKTETDYLGRVIKSYDAMGGLTTYTYDDTDRKFTVTYADGSQTATWKTRTGEILKTQDANGNITQFTYDKNGTLKTVTDPSGIITTNNTYDNSGRLYETIDATGTVTRYSYDAANRIVQKAVDPSGLNLRTFYEFDGQGRQLLVTTGYGTSDATVTKYSYNRKGQIRQIIVDPEGLQLSTIFTYDALGETVQIDKGTLLNPSQQITKFTYDKHGNKVKEQIDPDGLNLITTYQYDLRGNLVKKIDANGQPTHYAYDKENQLKYVVNAEGVVTENIYDLNGNIIKQLQYYNKISSLNLASTDGNTTTMIANSGSSLEVVSARVDINPNKSYKVRARIRQLNSSGSISLGVKTYSSSGVELRNTTPNTEVFAYPGGTKIVSSSDGWVTLEGVIAGFNPINANSSPNKFFDSSVRASVFLKVDATNQEKLIEIDSIEFIDSSTGIALNTNAQMEMEHFNYYQILNGKFAGTHNFRIDAFTTEELSRLIVPDAINDRQTNFVYDKLNRLKFTVNAEGAVSENIYDANGNVVNTIQYDKKISTSIVMSESNIKMSLASWNQDFSVNASGLNLPANSMAVVNGQLVLSATKTSAGTAPDFPQAWGTTRSVGTAFRYEFSTDGSTGNHYGTIGINATDWTRRHAVNQSGNTFYSEFVDANGVVQYVPIGTIKNNTNYILEIETDSNGSTLYLYEKGQSKFQGIVDRRNISGWNNLATWLLTVRLDSIAGNSTTKIDSIQEFVPSETRKTQFVYDKANRLRFTVNAEGAVSENIYDVNGNVIRTVAYSKTSSNSNLVLIQGTVQESSGTQIISSAETLEIQTTKTSDGITRVGRLTVTGELWITQGATDYKIADNVSEFQLLNNKIAFIKNGNLYVYDNATINTTTINGLAATATGVISFQLEGTRIGYLNNKNEFWVQDPAVSSTWTNQYANVKAFQMEGNRIGLLLNNGQLRVKEGDLYAGWWVLYENVTQFQLEGTRVGILTNGNLMVKEGVLNANWDTLYNNVSNFQLEGNRVAILTNNRLMVKEGALNAGWYTLGDNVSSISLVGNRLAAITNDGTLYFKEVLSAGWSLVRSNVQSVAMTADLFAYTEGAADRTTHYAYDKANRLRFTVNAEGGVIENIYDAHGNVVQTVQYDKKINEHLINGSYTLANISRLVDRSSVNNRVTGFAYDKANRQTKTTLAGWYDASEGKVYGAQEGQSDRFQRTIEVTYDAFGNAVVNKIRTGYSDYIYQFKTYDKLNREVFDVDGLGFVSHKLYTATGDISEVRRYAIGVGVMAYDGFSWKTSDLISHGALVNGGYRAIKYTYDRMGRQLVAEQQGVRDPLGYLTTSANQYNAFGEIVKQSKSLYSYAIAGRLALATTNNYFYYDKLGRQTWSVDAMGYGTQTEYSAFGDVLKTTEYADLRSGASITTLPTYGDDVRNRITSMTYDKLGRVKTTDKVFIDVNNSKETKTISSIDYNAFGEVWKSRDVMNNETVMSYNRLGQTTKIVEPVRSIANYAANRDVFTTGVTNTTPITTIAYNTFGERLSETRNGISIERQYDLAGNEIATKDGANNWSYQEFDVSGKVVRQWQNISVTGTSNETNYEHKLDRRFQYDATGRQIASVDIYNNQTQLTGQLNIYNGFGEVTHELKIWGNYTDINNGKAGIETSSFKTDATKNVTVAQYEYDANGQLSYKRSADGHTYYEYDLAGRLVKTIQKETQTTNVSNSDRTTVLVRDALGRVTRQELPGFLISSGYGLITTQTDVAKPVITRSYDRWGNLLSESGDTLNKTFTYNQDNQVLSEEGNFEYSKSYDGSSPATKLRREFEYNKSGQLLKETQKSIFGAGGEVSRVVATNTYDNVGQLTETQTAEQLRQSVSQKFIYDIHGNRIGTKDTFGHVWVDSYNENNQLTARYILRNGPLAEYTGTVTTGSTLTGVALARYQYDQAGRKYAEADGEGIYQYTKFDERNNIVVTRNRLGSYQQYDYDYLNNKTRESVFSSYIRRVPISWDEYGKPTNYDNVPTTDTTLYNEWSYFDGTTNDYKEFASDKIQSHTIAGDNNKKYSFSYTNFGELQRESKVGDLNDYVEYEYALNGLLAKVKEYKSESVNNTYESGYTITTTNVTRYLYDIRANRVAELCENNFYRSGYSHNYPVSGGSGTVAAISNGGPLYTYYQYDSLNRVTKVKSDKTAYVVDGINYYNTDLQSISYGYDEWGNRRFIEAKYQTASDTSLKTKTEWYSYNLDDQVLVEAGISQNGAAVINKSTGVAYGYDSMGRRKTQEKFLDNANWWLNSAAGGKFAEDYKLTTFTYNDLGLVKQSVESVIRRNENSYSTGDASTSSAAQAASVTNGYISQGYQTTTHDLFSEAYSYDNRGFKKTSELYSVSSPYASNISTLKRSIFTYNNNGGLLTQDTRRLTDNSLLMSIVNNYDTQNNLQSYSQTSYGSQTITNRYVYDYVLTYAGKQVSRIVASSSQNNTGLGTTDNSYDKRGRLIASRVTEVSVVPYSNQTGKGHRFYYYNTSGQMLFKAEKPYGGSYKTQNYYYSPTGGELASVGQTKVDISPLSSFYEGGSTPGSYTVNEGDSLMGIAQLIFGDAKLWYLLADANGLSMGPTDTFSQQDAGRALRIPNSQTSISNTSNNWKPYNPSEMIGDLTPSVSIIPPKQKGCNTFAIILMVVVAVVVSVFTAGAATATLGQVGAGFVGGFAGSAASQVVGVATGVQDSFSLRQAIASGIAGGITAGVGEALSSAGKAAAELETVGKIGKFAVNVKQGTEIVTRLSALGQGIQGASSVAASAYANKITGLDSGFSWGSMAAGFAGGYVQGGMGLNAGLNQTTGAWDTDDLMTNFTKGVFNGAIDATAQRLAGGGKQNFGMIAANSFGSALGSSIANRYELGKKGFEFGAKLRDAFGNVQITIASTQLEEGLSANLNNKNQKRFYSELGDDLAASDATLTAESDKAIDLMRKNQTDAFATESEKRADEQAIAKLKTEENRQNQLASMSTQLAGVIQQSKQNEAIVDTLMNNRKTDQYDAAQLQIAIAKQEGADRARAVDNINARQLQREAIYGKSSGNGFVDTMKAVGGITSRFGVETVTDIVNVSEVLMTGGLVFLYKDELSGTQLENMAMNQINKMGPSYFTGYYKNDEAATGMQIGSLALGGGLHQAGDIGAELLFKGADKAGDLLRGGFDKIGGLFRGKATNSGGFIRFTGNYDEHIVLRDFDVPRKRGIGGAHNKDEFLKYSNEYQIEEVIRHPTLDGVETIRYRMASLDIKGQPTGAYRAAIFEKTVYDPSKISNQQFMDWGRQAAAQAQSVGKLNREWVGTAPNGLEFRGYLDQTGAVKSFFPNF